MQRLICLEASRAAGRVMVSESRSLLNRLFCFPLVHKTEFSSQNRSAEFVLLVTFAMSKTLSEMVRVGFPAMATLSYCGNDPAWAMRGRASGFPGR